MKVAVSQYPDPETGSPCLTVTGRYLYFDADWNTRFPWGTCACLRAGKGDPARGGAAAVSVPGFTLDWNAPLGEPNRLYLWLGQWSVTVSLPQLRTCTVTGDYREYLTWPHLPDGWRHAIAVERRGKGARLERGPAGERGLREEP